MKYDTFYNFFSLYLTRDNYTVDRIIIDECNSIKATQLFTIKTIFFIDNYFDNVYLPWVTGDENTKNLIQTTYRGVHEFVPRVRGDCFAQPFYGKHPESITNNFETLKQRFDVELIECIKRKS